MLGPRTFTSNSSWQKAGVLAGMAIGLFGVNTTSLGVPLTPWPLDHVTPVQVLVMKASPW